MWLGYTVVNKKHGLRSPSNARGILLQRTLLKALCAFSCISKRKEIWPLFAAPTVVALVAVTLIFVSISKANLSFNTKSVGKSSSFGSEDHRTRFTLNFGPEFSEE